MSELPILRDVALEYFAGGWHPFPLPAGAKAPPPAYVTGYDAVDFDRAGIEHGIDWSGNLGLRMPADVIGLDIDCYRGGKATLDDLIARCGPLPDTWISHSGRDDGSGIRFFRVPPGLAWVHALPGVEIIQRSHRYSVAAPSMHPDGRRYGWWDQTEGAPALAPPTVEQLPELPWSWVARLSRAREQDIDGVSFATDGPGVAAFIAAHTRADSPSYLSVVYDHFVDQVNDGYSRHDTMTHCLLWALENVAAGVADAATTLDRLAELWVTAMGTDRRRAELASRHRVTEWEAMVRHAVGKVNAKSPEELAAIHDEHAGITMNVPDKSAPMNVPAKAEPAPEEPVSTTVDTSDEPAEQPPLVPLITFRDLPDPFTVPAITWHAENLLCRETHGELAGAEKSFKSYLGLMLDVGLAAGLDVLGYFPVTERQRVLVLVGEGGEGPFLRRLAEVCASYGITPARLGGWLRYTTDHASASSLRFLDGIRKELETFGPALVHADPWYAYQPAATESNQLTSVGATLEVVGELCRAGGATALINHHFNRQANGGLRQITGAGHAEWVDSWLLSRHRVAPDLTRGAYRLRLDVGSRQWGGGSYDVDLDVAPPFGMLRWRVQVAAEESDVDDKLASYRLELLRVGRRMKQPQTKTVWIQRGTGDDKKLSAAFDELIADDQLVPGERRGTFRLAPTDVPIAE